MYSTLYLPTIPTNSNNSIISTLIVYVIFSFLFIFIKCSVFYRRQNNCKTFDMSPAGNDKNVFERNTQPKIKLTHIIHESWIIHLILAPTEKKNIKLYLWRDENKYSVGLRGFHTHTHTNIYLRMNEDNKKKVFVSIPKVQYICTTLSSEFVLSISCFVSLS